MLVSIFLTLIPPFPSFTLPLRGRHFENMSKDRVRSAAGPQPRGPTAGADGNIYSIPANPVMTRLGLQDMDGEQYNKIQEIGGHIFQVPPAHKFHLQQAAQKFSSMAGGMNPVFNADRFNALRQRMQTGDKKDKDSSMQAMALLYTEELSKRFSKTNGLDYAEIERMFYPKYAPKYGTALKALGERKPLWWRKGTFSTLENLSRMPLERCSDTREAQFSFEEWYNLFWNYYQPFSPLAYLCHITSQSMIYSKELVDGLAGYLAERHAVLGDDAAKKAPILFFGPRIGKLGGLLNATGKVPVPIIHIHETPRSNPYLLAIPEHLQSEFKPHPIQKMTIKAALERYEPSMVLFSDMMSHQDETAYVRATGSVREYLCLGLADSYVEGSGWETWGCPRYRPKDSSAQPPFAQEGWAKLHLPHLSRWVIHKTDSDAQMGNGAVMAFMRQPLMPPLSKRLMSYAYRIKPFF